MQRILLTGLSGTGKSTVTEALAARGFKAIDLDTPQFSEWRAIEEIGDVAGSPVEPHRDWVWQEDPVAHLLATEDAPILIVSGCAPNMGAFLPRFDAVILLSTPPEETLARLAARTNNAYGKDPAEAARVLALKTSVEPRLRAVATHEIDTAQPLDAVIEQILDQMRRVSQGGQ